MDSSVLLILQVTIYLDMILNYLTKVSTTLPSTKRKLLGDKEATLHNFPMEALMTLLYSL